MPLPWDLIFLCFFAFLLLFTLAVVTVDRLTKRGAKKAPRDMLEPDSESPAPPALQEAAASEIADISRSPEEDDLPFGNVQIETLSIGETIVMQTSNDSRVYATYLGREDDVAVFDLEYEPRKTHSVKPVSLRVHFCASMRPGAAWYFRAIVPGCATQWIWAEDQHKAFISTPIVRILRPERKAA